MIDTWPVIGTQSLHPHRMLTVAGSAGRPSARRVAQPLANSTRMVEWVHEEVPGYPKRSVPAARKRTKALRKRVVAHLYAAPSGSPTCKQHLTRPSRRVRLVGGHLR